jgi:drug/metabolite transporter (DMT)-like permease
VDARRSLLLGSGAALLAAIAFAMNGPLSGLAFDRGMSTLGLVIWRGTFAGLLLGAFIAVAVARGRGLGYRSLDRRSATLLVAAGATGAVLNLAVFAAFERTTVALVLIAFYTYPAILAATGILFRGERLSRARLGSLGLAIAGMALVLLAQLDPAEGIRLDLVGLGLALVGAVCQVVYFLIGHAGFRSLPADQATLGVFLVSLPIYAAASLAGGGLADALAPPAGDPSVLLIVALIGTLGAAVPSVLVLTAIRRIGGTQAGIILMFEPVAGVALAALLLGESIVPAQVIGGALVIAGGVLLQAVPEREGGEVIVTEDEPAPAL